MYHIPRTKQRKQKHKFIGDSIRRRDKQKNRLQPTNGIGITDAPLGYGSTRVPQGRKVKIKTEKTRSFMHTYKCVYYGPPANVRQGNILSRVGSTQHWLHRKVRVKDFHEWEIP